MNVLKQYNLTNRPVVRSSASEQAKEGVVVNFIRKLPNEVFKKPRNLAGYQPTLREKEAELPVEGEAGAAAAEGVEDASAESAASVEAPAPRVFIVDKDIQ